DYIRELRQPLDERVLDGFAEAAREGEELRDGQALVSKEDDQVLQQRGPDRGGKLGRQRSGQIDAQDLRAQRACDLLDFEQLLSLSLDGTDLLLYSCRTSRLSEVSAAPWSPVSSAGFPSTTRAIGLAGRSARRQGSARPSQDLARRRCPAVPASSNQGGI